MIDYEFYPTPDPFTRWLFTVMAHMGRPIVGRLAAPCVGDGAIPRAVELRPMEFGIENTWVTNDLDPRWSADLHLDATRPELYTALGDIDWHVENPPFSSAVEIIEQATAHARVGVAMHLRASIHEVLKTGVRRTWLSKRPPTGILWLPRFAYQRSKKTGEWTTDSVCACWVIWMKDSAHHQFIRYAPESILKELDAFTKTYRMRMDLLMENLKSASLTESAACIARTLDRKELS